MGNCCSEQRIDGKVPRDIAPLQKIKIVGQEDSNGENFGSKVNDTYLGLPARVKESVRKYNLYRFEKSAAELKGTHQFKVKRGESEDMKFEGQMNGTKIHGKAHVLTKEGDLWVAPYEDGYASGTGAIYFKNGDYFFGRLVKSDLDSGKMVYADGTTYIGEFTNKKRNGKGVYTYKDGSTYDGQWEDDKEHGYGKMVVEAIWKNGIKTNEPLPFASSSNNYKHEADLENRIAKPSGSKKN